MNKGILICGAIAVVFSIAIGFVGIMQDRDYWKDNYAKLREESRENAELVQTLKDLDKIRVWSIATSISSDGSVSYHAYQKGESFIELGRKGKGK